MHARRRFLAAAAAALLPAAAPAAAAALPPLLEVRAYTTRPGRRASLIAQFERTFLDAYEAGGATIAGSFRDLHRPDRWVWLRAFGDAAARGEALSRFYASDAWRAGRDAANATIADVAPSLLLRAAPGGFPDLSAPPAGGAPGCFLVAIHPVDGDDSAFAEAYAAIALPRLAALSGAPCAAFVADRSPNAFPRQPVRAGALFVTLTRFASPSDAATFRVALGRDAPWRERVSPALVPRLAAPIDVLALAPTRRSLLR